MTDGGDTSGMALRGVRVLVTRARDQAGKTANALRARGAIAVELPTIEIAKPTDEAPIVAALASLSSYHAMAFTSENGVQSFFAAMDAAGLDSSAFGAARVFAIGPGTARALAARGVRGEVVGDAHRGESLAEALVVALRRRGELAGRRVLLPRAEVARTVIPDTLRAHGVVVDDVAVYRTVRPGSETEEALLTVFERGEIDAVLLTSGSTVDHLVTMLPDAASRLTHVVVASIGPITSEACAAHGVRVDVEATAATVTALIEALEQFFERKHRGERSS